MPTTADVIHAMLDSSGVSREVEERLDAPEKIALAAGARSWFGVGAAATMFFSRGEARLRSRFGFPDAVIPIGEGSFPFPLDGDMLISDDTTEDDRFGRRPLELAGLTVRRIALCVLRGADGEPVAVYCLADPEPLPGFAATYRDQLDALARQIEESLVTDTEVDRAADVQRSLLPRDAAPLDGYDIAGLCRPARDVGGDFYDWYPVDGGLAFVVADVMGKGLGSGLTAAGVRAALRSAANKGRARAAVTRVRRALGRDLERGSGFVTLVHARLRGEDGRVRYVDAGHGLAFVVAVDGALHRLESRNPPVGVMPDREWQEGTVRLGPGDTLVICSDGVLDLYDGTLAAIERVAEIVRAGSTAAEIVATLDDLATSADVADDVTIMVVRRDGPRRAVA